jgi:hypothetical protein
VAQLVVIDQIFIVQRQRKTRCPTNVRTVCSIGSGARLSAKHSAKAINQPDARSVAPSSKAPASEVIRPPSNPATTLQPSTGVNPNRSALHCIGIGSPLALRQVIAATRFS